MDAAAIRTRAADLPDEPGVYRFLDGDRTLYVGKAVSIRDRVRSYTDPRSDRIATMVERAGRIDATITETERQALLLEANLIKRHRPQYNVRLTDDKSYPMVQLTAHPEPRIEVTRDPDDGATVFGPYTDRGEVETVVKAAREVYGLRGCSDHKYRGRDRPCLDYEMGLCSAPCTDEVSTEQYAADVAAIEGFFRGKTGRLAEPIRTMMADASDEAAFERAANLRDRLRTVEAFHDDRDGAVSDPDDERSVDVLGVDGATVARLHAERGQLVDRTRHRLSVPEGEGDPALLGEFVPQYYADRALPDALLLPEPLPADVERWLSSRGVTVRVPSAGREARLVELAFKNARQGNDGGDPCADLARALEIDTAGRIEGFDVSHARGRAAVGSNVRLADGEPKKSGYRRKRLTAGDDDYANLRELLRWRAERAVEGRDDRPDPDLLVVDGGEGQLRAARAAIDEVGWAVPVVALAKEEELIHTEDGVLNWPDDSPRLRLCRRVRDEAHRFAVQYHRSLRDDVSTALDGVPGVGPERRARLLGRFGSVDGVRAASRGELLQVEGIGEATVEAIETRL